MPLTRFKPTQARIAHERRIATGEKPNFFSIKFAQNRKENINIEVHPGYDHVLTVTPTNPGTYSIICNEYCGVNHHTMASRLYVVK